jgi:predicted DNA-binding WGR domain protein
MRIYMQTPVAAGHGPRYYHLFLQPDFFGGWTLVREWGHQGSGGRLRREHHATWDAAIAALTELRDRQLKRGYQVVFAQGQYASAAGE